MVGKTSHSSPAIVLCHKDSLPKRLRQRTRMAKRTWRSARVRERFRVEAKPGVEITRVEGGDEDPNFALRCMTHC